MTELLAIGDLSTDMLLQVKRFPLVDDEVQVDRYIHLPGGDAANIAAAGARLGLKSSILACIGADDEGNLLAHALELSGVETKWLQRTTESKTGLVIATVREDGQRNLLTYRGANQYRSLQPEIQQIIKNVEILHISDPLPGEVKELLAVLKKQSPKITSIDPGSITAGRGFDDLRGLLSLMTVCFVNENELQLLTGTANPVLAISLFNQGGPEILVVKQGEKGCVVASHGQTTHVPGFTASVVDATGAGDAFNAGFLYGLHNKYSLLDAARFANAAGALTTRALGAQSAQPTLQEVQKLMSGG